MSATTSLLDPVAKALVDASNALNELPDIPAARGRIGMIDAAIDAALKLVQDQIEHDAHLDDGPEFSPWHP